jgi:hypothetical protein
MEFPVLLSSRIIFLNSSEDIFAMLGEKGPNNWNPINTAKMIA